MQQQRQQHAVLLHLSSSRHVARLVRAAETQRDHMVHIPSLGDVDLAFALVAYALGGSEDLRLLAGGEAAALRYDEDSLDLTRRMGEGRLGEALRADKHLTRTGVLIGTPAFEPRRHAPP